MILILAKLGTAAFALWLIAAGLFMMLAPRRCLKLLGSMGSTPAIHFGEHFLRGLAGLCIMGIAAHTSHMKAFLIVGGFILATSALIGLAPRRWHHRYAVFWSEVISPWMLRLMSVMPLVVGAYLIYVVVSI